jgi:hypothetical protein
VTGWFNCRATKEVDVMSKERPQYTVLVTRGERAWLAYIPALGIVTQGDAITG